MIIEIKKDSFRFGKGINYDYIFYEDEEDGNFYFMDIVGIFSKLKSSSSQCGDDVYDCLESMDDHERRKNSIMLNQKVFNRLVKKLNKINLTNVVFERFDKGYMDGWYLTV